MRWARAVAQRVPRSRVGVTIAILAAVSGVIFVTIAMMFARLDERQQGIETSVRENALWAVFQADSEAGRFGEAVAHARLRPTAAALQEAALRYDVLYSRAGIVDRAISHASLGEIPNVTAARKGASETITDLAPLMDAVVTDDRAFRATLPEIARRAAEIRIATETLALRVNSANNAARVSERAHVQGAYRAIATGVVVLTLALLLVVALLVAQLGHILRTGRRLEALSARNARIAAEAEAGNRAKTAFLAAMSHEIRSPLNGIIGMADILARADLGAAQAEQVAVIRQSGDLLLDVINDVLDFSKLESGAVDLAPTRFALAEVLETVRALLGPRAEAKGLRLELDAPDIEIESDPALLRQVLVNLVGNAVKFTGEGTVWIVVRDLAEGVLRVEVVDTGIGIAAESIPKLFNEFSQVDGSVTRRFGGTGLGLAICKRLVGALGGRIGVESAPGRGSRFWFEIPSGAVLPRAPRPPAAEAAAPESGFVGRVLVVEDNPVNRKVACGLLERAGLVVDCAEDGRIALARTEAQVYDLVLMDMQMPVLDGLSATRAMRARGYDAPIVGLTANAFVADREACLAAGMDDFLSKPVTWAKLREVLRARLVCRPCEAPPPASGAVDAGHRAALEAELGGAFVARLIAEFAAESLRMLDEARAARDCGDAATLGRLLHTIKGAGQTLGFVEIGRLAEAARHPEAAAGALDRLEVLVRGSAAAGLAA